MSRLIAIGDIHGCFNPFYELVTQRIKLTKSDHLVLLGDYVDKGMKTKEVVDFIIEMQQSGFNITPLIGNHEVMLIESYNDSANLPLWLMNKGRTTLESFGIRDIRDLDKKYLDFFSGLQYYLISGRFIFVHAGLKDEQEDPFSDRFTMIWESRPVYNNPFLAGKIIVHGHRPKALSYVNRLIMEKSNVLPVDTGCVYGLDSGYGYLSAIDLGSMKLVSIPCC